MAVAQLSSKNSYGLFFNPVIGSSHLFTHSHSYGTFFVLLHQEKPQHKIAVGQLLSSVFDVFTYPFEQAFKVVAGGCHEQAFIRQFNASGIHPSHAQEVDEGTNDWFDGGLP